MTHVKNTFAALAVLFSVGFLFLALFASGTVSGPSQHVPAASHTDTSIVKLETATRPDGGFVLKSYGESTPRSGVFLIAKESPGICRRSFVVSPLFLRIIWAPKVSRYISKSVLNL